MTEKQKTHEDLLIVRLEEVVKTSIKTTVNGKVDRLSDKLDAHIDKHDADWEEIKPFIQGIAGAKILGSGLKWVAGIGIAYMTVKALITGTSL